MRKKLIFSLLGIILLLTACADSHLAPGEAASAIESDAVPTQSVYVTPAEATASGESVSSISQAVALKNPTFQEVMDFILRDPTNNNDFALNQYECRHFATDVNNNAEAEGLRCAFVLLCFDQGQHAVVAFDTTDRGLVYIEPQTDTPIQPEVGGYYQGKEIKEILIAW